MLDQFILFTICTFIVQIAYSVLIGKDPFNSLLAGLFASLGQFALLSSLRVQMSDVVFEGYSNKKAFVEYIAASLLLFLACLCLIG